MAARPDRAWQTRRRTVYGTIAGTTLAWSFAFISFLDAKNAALWAGIALLSLLRLAAGRGGFRGFRLLAPAWAGLGVAVAAGLLTGRVPLFVAVEGLRVFGMLLFTSLSCEFLVDTGGQRHATYAVVFSGAAAALLALLQYAGWLPGLFPAFPGYDQAMYSVFGNQGLLGGYLALSLVALLGLAGTAGTGGRRAMALRWLLGLLGILLFSALLLAQSRGALVALLAGCCGLAALRQIRARLAIQMLLAGLAVAATLHGIRGFALWERWLGTFTAGDVGGHLRPWIWLASLDLFADHALLGVGLGNYAAELPLYLGNRAGAGGGHPNMLVTYHAHLDLLEMLCETGILGLAFLVWIAARIRARAPQALCCLLCLLVFSLVHPAWYSTPHALAGLLFYTLCAATSPAEAAKGAGSARWRIARHAAVFSAAAAGGASVLVLALYPSFQLREAEDLHLAGLPAGGAYERAVRAWGASPEAHESYGIYALEQGDYARAWEQLLRAKTALDTGRICQLLAMAAAARGDGEGGCYWYRQCLARWPWDAATRDRVRAACPGD